MVLTISVDYSDGANIIIYMRKIADKKDLYKKVLIVALPIMLQELLDAAVNCADVLMLNHVGQSSISAVSLANSMISVFFMFLFGIGTGLSILCAQYYGKGDMATIEKVEGIGLRYSLIVASIGCILALTIPKYLMRIYTNDENLIEIGAQYLTILAPGLMVWAISVIYMSILRCIDKVGVSTALEALALVANVILNAILIFGLFGAPQMGVAGAAIATVASRVIQLIGCFIVSVFQKPGVSLTFKTVLLQNKILQKDFIGLAVPAIGNDIVWALAFSTYSVIMGHLGDDAVAAYSICSIVRTLGTVLCYGVAAAAGIVVGQILGEGDTERGMDAGHVCFRMSFMAGAAGGLIALALTPLTLGLVDLSETAMHYLKIMLLINSYYITGTAVNSTLIVGVFRAGGDSRFGFKCDLIDMWAYAVPLGFIAAFVLKLPVIWVFVLLCTDEFVKWPWVFKHFYKYGWAKDITREMQ